MKSAKVVKLSKKKVKISTIFNGISRAAACDVDIGNMVNLIGGPSMSLNVSNFLVYDKTLGKDLDIIPATPLILPVQTVAHNLSSPAIAWMRLFVVYKYLEKEFQCPMCSRLGDGKDKPLQYAFIGFDRQKKVKMAWPMAIINLNLDLMKDDYLTSMLHMQGGAHVSKLKKLAPDVEFISCNTKAGSHSTPSSSWTYIQMNTLACYSIPEGTPVAQAS
ncbi:hypothetical protein EV702DRAFT_1247546 [Suillus placidus]|uniref:Uncharacterized protein n=1 Tax=Suillus placidus TaxID=48579 RepID=A0A9P6ZMI1_9AGAM|nr:hypothetical protein EV702DRAFT_1247546 [Suillus placidus]